MAMSNLAGNSRAIRLLPSAIMHADCEASSCRGARAFQVGRK